jgi:Right handed beta helix region
MAFAPKGRRRAIAWAWFAWLSAAAAGGQASAANRWVVCADRSPAGACAFIGMAGIQQAIDRADDGDTVFVRAGTYVPGALREVRYKKYTIPGAVVIQKKTLTLEGEEGTVIDGSLGPPATGIVVEGGRVTIGNLTVRNLRVLSSEDDIYDGHGLFLIDADVRLRGLTFDHIEKMSLTLRGSSRVAAERLLIQDGHVGIWLEESAKLRLNDSVVRRNQSAGLCAYGHASAQIYNSVFDENHDDGIYAEGHARLEVTNALVMRNIPFGIRGTKSSRVRVGHTVLYANQHAISEGRGENRVTQGPVVLEKDPAVDADYRLSVNSPLAALGDPGLHDSTGATLPIGLVSRCSPGCQKLD